MEYKKFDSQFDAAKLGLKIALLLPLLLVLIHMFVNGMSLQMLLASGVLLVLVVGLMLWQMNDTYYLLDSRFLHYRSGVRRGKIALLRIDRISQSVSYFPLGDASRSLKGLIIYAGNEQIFVGPRDESEFLALLRQSNPAIRTEI